MNDTVVTIIWIVLGVAFGLPLILEGIVSFLFGILKNFTNFTFDAGKALVLPALIVFMFKYFNDRKKKEDLDDRVDL